MGKPDWQLIVHAKPAPHTSLSGSQLMLDPDVSARHAA
jgi:hypothetical protein